MPLSTVATPRVELPEALEIASKEVDAKILSDSKFPSLEEQLGVTGKKCWITFLFQTFSLKTKFQQNICEKRVLLPNSFIWWNYYLNLSIQA